MNDLSTDVSAPAPNMALMMLDNEQMSALVKFSELMATSSVTIPQHLQGKPADCLAIAMQAAQWGMNPFAVAQKTHVVSGRLGYEAQLVNAVITSLGAIDGHFHYEFKGAGQDLECRVGATPRGSVEIVWGEWLRNGDVKTRNSPLWNVNPKQQLGYLQVKNWARLYCPAAILGVYTADELEPDAMPQARTGPRRKSGGKDPVQMVEEVPLQEQRRTEAAPHAASEAPAPAPAPVSAEPKAQAPTGKSGGISGGQVAYLRNKLKSAGVSEQIVCDRFQVTGIELLSPEQFDEVKGELLQMA